MSTDERRPARRSRDITPQRLREWKRRLRDAPDLRWEKVRRIREAISRDAYDTEPLIERLIDSVENDIGVLCRRAAGEE